MIRIVPSHLEDPLNDKRVLREIRKALKSKRVKERRVLKAELFWMPYQVIEYLDHGGSWRRICIDLYYYDALASSHLSLLLIKNKYLRHELIDTDRVNGVLVRAKPKRERDVIMQIHTLLEEVISGIREYSAIVSEYARKLGKTDIARALLLPTGFKALKDLRRMEDASRRRGELILAKAIIEDGLSLRHPPLDVKEEAVVFYYPKVILSVKDEVVFVEVGGGRPSLDKVFTNLYSRDECFKALTDRLLVGG